MDRRSFIKSSAALSSGLFVSFSYADNKTVASGNAIVNPWLQISPDNSATVFVARSEMGQDVYTSMTMLIAEELDYPIGKIKVIMAPNNPALYGNAMLGGAQITGGSSAMREAWDKLRMVGATAREMLIAAAAEKWKVPAASVTASNGMLTSGSHRATYGELAADAAKQQHSGKPTLKSAKQYKFIGKKVPRLDTKAKVNGTAVYGVDVREPNMLAASLAMCPVIGGKVKSFDASVAKTVKGIESIVEVPDGVAVLAKDYYTAKKARDLLKIEWDFGPSRAVKDIAQVEEGLRQAAQKTGAIVNKAGNVDNPLDGAVKKVSAEYMLPFLAHATLEPVNCSASIANGECHVWGPIQFQQGASAVAAAASGLPESKVFIHTTFIGGGYGRKLELDFISQAVSIAKASGKPVRMIWAREDDMTHDFYRPISYHQVSGGLDASGKLVGLSTKMISPSVTARAFPGFVVNGNDPFMSEGSGNITYGVPNLRIENVIHDTGIRVGYWRAVSNNLNAFAIESFMDELAQSAGKDAVEFRMGLLGKHPRAQKVLSTAAQKAGWGKKRTDGRSLGIAQMECYDAYVALVAEVSVKDNVPTVHKLTCVVDCGIAVRPDQVRAQLESAILLGFSSAMKNKITFKDGATEQRNFDSYPMLRMSEAPTVDITIIEGGDKPSGMGEVGVPLVAPAIANAITRATGKRPRSMPFLA
ncbi:xanthine dehydrogenase family protein molybdopterin-binding subunit [Polynucleobacter sp. MWH-Spelu-300-X4]|uniref:xanthine dehydrogenase family protein molybdopterin-binding subunit n=1 Tax=Polynucleobacter sp. MWH-Spelu-300-X4 TaxID=2689109 RepID=UPI001BFE1F24|nr:molybdopterin cofactor-binding domain-containing protein [Polynucleobacter sp. MWH-Spelu-300-X4]QWD80351.1 xanthine dehydrogenase family protein molybdopterin-binding subunit [Polynucleobacter sp. MWH-Spelu-300-X4]